MSDIRRTLEASCDPFKAHDLDAIVAHFADHRVLSGLAGLLAVDSRSPKNGSIPGLPT